MCETVFAESVPASSKHKVERKMSTRATWNNREAISATWLACVLFYVCDIKSFIFYYIHNKTN